MSAIYATPADYFEFIGEAMPDDLTPADKQKLQAQLRRASSAVRNGARTGRYRLGKDALPLSGVVREAFRDATCSQVDALLQGSGDSTGAGTDWDSVSMLGVQFSRTRGTVAERDVADDGRLTPEAIEHLVNSGIFSNAAVRRPL